MSSSKSAGAAPEEKRRSKTGKEEDHDKGLIRKSKSNTKKRDHEGNVVVELPPHPHYATEPALKKASEAAAAATNDINKQTDTTAATTTAAVAAAAAIVEHDTTKAPPPPPADASSRKRSRTDDDDDGNPANDENVRRDNLRDDDDDDEEEEEDENDHDHNEEEDQELHANAEQHGEQSLVHSASVKQRQGNSVASVTAAAAAAAAASSTTHPLVAPATVPNARRLTPHTGLYSHFTYEGITCQAAPNGKGRAIPYVYCKACYYNYKALQAQREQALAHGKGENLPALPPLRTVKRIRRDCRTHLRICPLVSPQVREQYAPDSTTSPTARGGKDSDSSSPIRLAGRATAGSKAQGIGGSAKSAGANHHHHSSVSATVLLNFHQNLLDFVVDTDVPLGLVERPSFQKLIVGLCPGLKPHIEEGLAVTLLDRRTMMTDRDRQVHMRNALDTGRYLGLIFDDYRDGHVAICINVGKASYRDGIRTFEGIEQHGRKLVGAAAAFLQTVVLDHCSMHGSDLRYILTNESGPFAAARGILTQKNPQLLGLGCFAQMINRLAREILTEYSLYTTVDQAVSAANELHKPSEPWLDILSQKQKLHYGNKGIRPISVLTSSWWSCIQATLATQLRSHKACKEVALHGAGELPAPLHVWADELWWEKLRDAELLIRPLTDASFLLQRTENTLAHIVLMFFNMARHLIIHGQSKEAVTTLLSQIEASWMQQEHLLLLLSFSLHPAYRNVAVSILDESEARKGGWTRRRNSLSRARLSMAAIYYYEKFNLTRVEASEQDREDDIEQMKEDLDRWLRKDSVLEAMWIPPHGFSSIEDSVGFWLANVAEHPALSRLAVLLLGAPVQRSPCERVWDKYNTENATSLSSAGHPPLRTAGHLKMSEVKDALKTQVGADATVAPSTTKITRLFCTDEFTDEESLAQGDKHDPLSEVTEGISSEGSDSNNDPQSITLQMIMKQLETQLPRMDGIGEHKNAGGKDQSVSQDKVSLSTILEAAGIDGTAIDGAGSMISFPELKSVYIDQPMDVS